MKPKYCQSAGLARNCGDCKHNPLNQSGGAKGQPIKPSVPTDLRCPFWKSVASR